MKVAQLRAVQRQLLMPVIQVRYIDLLKAFVARLKAASPVGWRRFAGSVEKNC